MWGRHWHRPAASAAVFVVVVVAGCTSGHTRAVRNDSAESSTSTTTAPATSTTTPPKPPSLYSFDNSVPPPPLINTGTDYPRIAESLLAFSNWVLAHHPTDFALREVSAAGSSIERGLSSDVRELRTTNRRLYEQTNAPDDVALINATPHAASLRVTEHLTARTLIDAAGHVVDRVTPGTTSYKVLLAENGGGRWYLAAVDRIAPR